VDGQSGPRKNCRVWGQLTSTAWGLGEEYISCLFCLLATVRQTLDWESKHTWKDCSHSPELPEGGKGAGALLAIFSQKSVDTKAMRRLNSAPPPAAKVHSSFHFIYSNSPKPDCSKWPAVDGGSGLGAEHSKPHI